MSEKRKLSIPRGICKICDKEVALRAAGGDWVNSIYPRWHKHEGKVCEGVWMETEITCEPLIESRALHSVLMGGRDE